MSDYSDYVDDLMEHFNDDQAAFARTCKHLPGFLGTRIAPCSGCSGQWYSIQASKPFQYCPYCGRRIEVVK